MSGINILIFRLLDKFSVKSLMLMVWLVVPFLSVGSESNTKDFSSPGNEVNQRKVKKLFYKAEDLFFYENYRDAIPIYTQLDSIDPSDSDYYNYQIGLCYLYSNIDNNRAIEYLEKVKEGMTQGEIADLFYYHLGKAHHLNGNFQKAQEAYEAILALEVNNEDMEMETFRMIEMCESGKELSKTPLNILIYNAGDSLNSMFSDYKPVGTISHDRIIFTSRRGNISGNSKDKSGRYFEDIYFSNRNEFGNWAAPRNLSEDINTKKHEASASISRDGNTLYIYKGDQNGAGLYVTNYDQGKWSKPKSLGENINSDFWETSANRSGNRIYFVSNRRGGIGGRDMYYSELQETGEWSTPVNLFELNTEFDEESPYLTDDGKTMYFSSQGHNTIGGFDIFKSVLKEDGEWDTPVNVGIPFNSPADEVHFMVSEDMKRGYFSSTRPGGFGETDIYTITFADNLEPNILVRGTITNNKFEPLAGNVKVVDKESGKVVFNAFTDNNKSDYVMILKPEHDYELVVGADGYRKQIAEFKTPKQNVSDFFELYQSVIFDKKLAYGEVIGEDFKVNNIFEDLRNYTKNEEVKKTANLVNRDYLEYLLSSVKYTNDSLVKAGNTSGKHELINPQVEKLLGITSIVTKELGPVREDELFADKTVRNTTYYNIGESRALVATNVGGEMIQVARNSSMITQGYKMDLSRFGIDTAQKVASYEDEVENKLASLETKISDLQKQADRYANSNPAKAEQLRSEIAKLQQEQNDLKVSILSAKSEELLAEAKAAEISNPNKAKELRDQANKLRNEAISNELAFNRKLAEEEARKSEINKPRVLLSGIMKADEMSPTNAVISVRDANTGEIVINNFQPDEEGNYMMILQPGKDYELLVKSDGFKNRLMAFSTPENSAGSSFNEIYQSITLDHKSAHGVEIGESAQLRNFFENLNQSGVHSKVRTAASRVNKNDLKMRTASLNISVDSLAVEGVRDPSLHGSVASRVDKLKNNTQGVVANLQHLNSQDKYMDHVNSSTVFYTGSGYMEASKFGNSSDRTVKTDLHQLYDHKAILSEHGFDSELSYADLEKDITSKTNSLNSEIKTLEKKLNALKDKDSEEAHALRKELRDKLQEKADLSIALQMAKIAELQKQADELAASDPQKADELRAQIRKATEAARKTDNENRESLAMAQASIRHYDGTLASFMKSGALNDYGSNELFNIYDYEFILKSMGFDPSLSSENLKAGVTASINELEEKVKSLQAEINRVKNSDPKKALELQKELLKTKKRLAELSNAWNLLQAREMLSMADKQEKMNVSQANALRKKADKLLDETRDYDSKYKMELAQLESDMSSTEALIASGTSSSVSSEAKSDAEIAALPKGSMITQYEVLFGYDKSYVSPAFQKDVDKAVKKMLSNNSLVLEIYGHTDSKGSNEYNIALSRRRAQAVADYAASKGVNRKKIKIVPKGESEPIAPNTRPDGTDDPDSRAKNRRSEIRVIKG